MDTNEKRDKPEDKQHEDGRRTDRPNTNKTSKSIGKSVIRQATTGEEKGEQVNKMDMGSSKPVQQKLSDGHMRRD